MPEPLSQTMAECRALLGDLTPLKTDCGRLCAAACCKSLEGEETGMLLFPGEERYYAGREGFRVIACGEDRLLVCSGQCERSQRPLSCRIFPLLPLLREDGVKVTMDARARAVCPLFSAGKSGLDEAFVQAVRACGHLLAEDENARPFLARLTQRHDELRALRRAFGGR